MQEMTNVEKMLRALLRKDKLIRWVGGYVYGRTSNDDPFIILYAPQEALKEKEVRVYEQDFKKLPSFIDTAVPANITNDGNPNKDKARRMGIYHECPAFEILVYQGKDTQMGPEIRFDDVLRITSSTKHYAQQQTAVQPTQAPQVQAQPKPAQPASEPAASGMDYILIEEAEKAESYDNFIKIVNDLRPFYQDKADSFFKALFPRGWRHVGDKRAACMAMITYADMRTEDHDHDRAKAMAYDAYRAVLA